MALSLIGSTMSLELSRRAQSLGTENAFVVLAEVNKLIAEGYDITSFCIGQPDFASPPHVQEAGHEAIRLGREWRASQFDETEDARS